MAKGKKTPPKEETKNQRFQRVVLPRVQKALKAIQLIGNCAGSGYECSDTEAAQMFNALTDAVNSAQEKFMRKSVSQAEFKFTK